jgi:hypothetical protein
MKVKLISKVMKPNSDVYILTIREMCTIFLTPALNNRNGQKIYIRDWPLKLCNSLPEKILGLKKIQEMC